MLYTTSILYFESTNIQHIQGQNEECVTRGGVWLVSVNINIERINDALRA